MKKVTLFLCDIYGTYIKSDELANVKDVKELLENLEKLRIINNSEKILFSFFSTENKQVVEKCLKDLELNNNYENVEFGLHFFEDGYFKLGKTFYTDQKGKISQILFYLNTIKDKYHIDKIYYADDTEIYHYMLESILIDDQLNENFESIIPKYKCGLKELNGIICEISKSSTYHMKNSR